MSWREVLVRLPRQDVNRLPNLSVVMDNTSTAWQRLNGKWWAVGQQFYPEDYLPAQCAPYLILYAPGHESGQRITALMLQLDRARQLADEWDFNASQLSSDPRGPGAAALFKAHADQLRRIVKEK